MPALEVAKLVVARVLERVLEALEAARPAGLLGHLGDQLARLLELALEPRDRCLYPVELNRRLSDEAVAAEPWPLRHHGNPIALQHDATLPTQPTNAAPPFAEYG